MRTITRALIAGGTIVAAVLAFAYLLPPTDIAPIRPERVERDDDDSDRRTRVVASSERDRALARAQVWREPAVPIAKAFLGKDPKSPAYLECTFKLDTPSGTTPKFDCVDSRGSERKVKYGVGAELPAEAAATRLLTALGFGADSITLVERLRCFGCPKEPFTVMKLVAATRADKLYERVANEGAHEDFSWVAVEEKFPATAIETVEGDEGWAFFELAQVTSAAGGAPRAQVDALRLLSVFLAHWDNKAENQRLVCLSENWVQGAECPAPFLMLQDVGATFGPRKVDLRDWRQAPIWDDRASCRLTMRALPVSGATFQTVRVGNEGRVFLARLLEQLSDAQLADLFSGARFDQRRGPLDRSDPVSDWVTAFKARRRLIAEGPDCPPV